MKPRWLWMVLLLGASCFASASRAAPLPVVAAGDAAGAGPTATNAIFKGMLRQARWVMGTQLVVAVEAPSGVPAEALLASTFAVAEQLDRLLSDYRVDSALSRLNGQPVAQPLAIAPAFYRFLLHCARYTEVTHGAFDLSAGALVDVYRKAWPRTPSAAALQRALAATGPSAWQLRAPSTALVNIAGLRLDPGAIGKGYAVDAMVAHLRQHGVRRAFIDFGGSSLFGLGAPRHTMGWPVLVPGLKQPYGVVLLHNEGLSASQSRPVDTQGRPGRAHVVDPRHGSLVRAQRFAVAIAPSATDVEVATTALVVDPQLQPTLAAAYLGLMSLVHEQHRTVQIDAALKLRLQRAATAIEAGEGRAE